MSTPLPTSKPTIRLSIWRRIFDKLCGGPPNQAKLEELKKKPWFIHYKITLFFLLFSFAMLFSPEIATYINRHPDPNTLDTLKVKVLGTYEKYPHFLVELPDGSARTMEWPVPISFQGGYNSYLLDEAVRNRLTGCLATVRGTPLRWTITNRFRIWELDCSDEHIHIGMNITIPYMQRRINTQISSWLFLLPIWFFFFLISYLRERRGNV